jgi:SAM-dependent methyltransferase
MHFEVQQFVHQVKHLLPQHFHGKKVLEVGSLNINGTVRVFFSECDYTGIDLAEGPGVDKTISIHELIEPETYDVVISTEMLEHDKHWQTSLKQMYDNIKPGGLFILTCAGPERPEHGTTRTSPQDSPFTTDYYRNISAEDFMSILPEGFFESPHLQYVRGLEDLMFFGLKKNQ